MLWWSIKLDCNSITNKHYICRFYFYGISFNHPIPINWLNQTIINRSKRFMIPYKVLFNCFYFLEDYVWGVYYTGSIQKWRKGLNYSWQWFSLETVVYFSMYLKHILNSIFVFIIQFLEVIFIIHLNNTRARNICISPVQSKDSL